MLGPGDTPANEVDVVGLSLMGIMGTMLMKSHRNTHSLTSAMKEELGKVWERAQKEGAFWQSAEAAEEMVKWKRVVLGQAEGQRKETLT